jgi:hypothetical protein
MATIDWPDDLPQVFLEGSYNEGMPDNVIRDTYDVGAATLRRRSTAAIYPVTGTMVMTDDQWVELKAFIADVLLQGALPFGIPEQGDCDSPTGEWLVRFTSPPKRQRMGYDWQVTLELEVLP